MLRSNDVLGQSSMAKKKKKRTTKTTETHGNHYPKQCYFREELIRMHPWYPDMSHSMTKPTKWHVRTAKTQISLGIRPVWSESLLSAWRNLGSLATHKAHSEDSDQTGRMPRLIWVFAGRTSFCWFSCASAHMRILSPSFHMSSSKLQST